MIRRPKRPARNRRALDPSNVPAGPFLPVSTAVVTGKLELAFPAPVILAGVPPITVNGEAPTAVTIVNANTIQLTYAEPVTALDEYVIPDRMSQIRTVHGGYLAAAARAIG